MTDKYTTPKGYPSVKRNEQGTPFRPIKGRDIPKYTGDHGKTCHQLSEEAAENEQ